MPCYHPLPAWYARERNEESGKRPITFRLAEGFKDRPVSVPCGTCLGCRLERAREWAVRCMHEASLYEENCFVTLTYDDAHKPKGGTLDPDHMTRFLKRLRWKFGERYKYQVGTRISEKTGKVLPVYKYAFGRSIRYFQCGEYGDRFGRPHHHALLFNLDFKDREFYRSQGDVKLYTSGELAKLWPYGFSTVGDVTFESAGYVARYTLKKVDGSSKPVPGRMEEYLTMSRRPGIGKGWIDRFIGDVYPSDELVVNGHVTKPPRYYDDQAEKVMPGSFKEVKLQRRLGAAGDPDASGRRLVVREAVKEAATKALLRDLE